MLGAPFDSKSVSVGHAFLAHGKPFDQNGEPCNESNALSHAASRRALTSHSTVAECWLPSASSTRVEGRSSLFLFQSSNRRWHRRRVWFVYILRCADGSLYVGETHDVAQRLIQHNKGRAAAHTSKRRPVHVAYVEERPNREGALVRERQLKRWSRSKKEALIAGDLAALKRL